MERRMVQVRCPATTANLGAGYDCIGMAVDLWNELTVRRADQFDIQIEGEGADLLPRDRTNLVVTGVEAAFRAAGKPLPDLSYHLINRIPFARGLGSSSAAIVAGIIAGCSSFLPFFSKSLPLLSLFSSPLSLSSPLLLSPSPLLLSPSPSPCPSPFLSPSNPPFGRIGSCRTPASGEGRGAAPSNCSWD